MHIDHSQSRNTSSSLRTPLSTSAPPAAPLSPMTIQHQGKSRKIAPKYMPPFQQFTYSSKTPKVRLEKFSNVCVNRSHTVMVDICLTAWRWESFQE